MLSAGGCIPALYSPAQTLEDHTSESGSSLNRRKHAGRGGVAVLPKYPLGPEMFDAEAGYIQNVLIESLNTPLGPATFKTC